MAGIREARRTNAALEIEASQYTKSTKEAADVRSNSQAATLKFDGPGMFDSRNRSQASSNRKKAHQQVDADTP